MSLKDNLRNKGNQNESISFEWIKIVLKIQRTNFERFSMELKIYTLTNFRIHSLIFGIIINFKYFIAIILIFINTYFLSHMYFLSIIVNGTLATLENLTLTAFDEFSIPLKQTRVNTKAINTDIRSELIRINEISTFYSVQIYQNRLIFLLFLLFVSFRFYLSHNL